MATVQWHAMWKQPFTYKEVDRVRLQRRGYSFEDDLEHVADLPLKVVKPALKMGLDYEPVKQELTDFINQKHSPKEQGDLMMMVLSDRVNQSGKSTGQCYTMFDLAHIIMNRATAQGRRIAVLVHVREGVHLIASSRDPCTSSPHGKLLTDPVNGTPLTQVSDGVQQVDDHPEFGLRVPVVVIVYHMGGRSATIRSMLRVITHSIAAYTAGRTSAAVHQMLMRYAGLTQQVRRNNGFKTIRLICPKEHLTIVRDLGDFTSKVLELAGTGNVQGLRECFQHQYSGRFGPLVQLRRGLVRQKLSPRGASMRFSVDPNDLDEGQAAAGKPDWYIFMKAVWRVRNDSINSFQLNSSDMLTRIVKRSDVVDALQDASRMLDQGHRCVISQCRSKHKFLQNLEEAGPEDEVCFCLTKKGWDFCMREFGVPQL